jgi:hypothetical protein
MMSGRVAKSLLLFASVSAASAARGEPAPATSRAAIRWRHPAGLVTDETIAEVKAKLAAHEWARRTYAARKAMLDKWLAVPSEKLQRVFPKKRGNVYHNFSCPQDRRRLTFDPFDADAFRCPSCGRAYPPETDARIYPPNDRYHGTMYDGWACLFYEEAGSVAADMGLVGCVEGGASKRYFERGIEILMLYADTIEHLPTKPDNDPQMRVILTYHREGDNKVLYDLACAYELLRDRMTPGQRARFERVVLGRMLDDIMLEPIYTYNHNNLYQWHRTLVQTAMALERDDLIDWCFGYGAFDPEHQPEHRSIRRLAATHFKPDGAYWEMCSGYHLYPLHYFCELAVLSRNLSRMDPARFPSDRYDLTDPSNPSGNAIRNALQWFMSMAMPDRTMPTIGDSMAPRAGMDDYYTTAEVGYRFFGLDAVGDYERYRKNQRTWAGLPYGAPEIVQRPTPYTSSYLSSGWVSLRNEWCGNKVWIGLNALIPGGGHQHADRLALLSYSHGQLLALEKATPYNEGVTRELGTFSQSHNTVTVDGQSQKQGEALTGQEIPKVAYFFAGPVVKFAELHGDRIYPQTKVYRRSVVLIEDVCVDLFRVEGGTTHDWIVNHAGAAPRLSMPTDDGTFAPAEWLYNGTKRVRHGRTDGAWDAQWKVDDVTSRLTMLGAAGTDIYALETYPIDNAVVTPEHPPCQTLCVRRRNNAPFLAVWDAWRDLPNLKNISRGDRGDSVCVKTASNTYYILFSPGETRFQDGVSMKADSAFAVLRNQDALAFVGGTRLRVHASGGALEVATDRTASVSAQYADGSARLDTAGAIQYDTYAGADHLRAIPSANVQLGGNLWHIRHGQ